jgi:transposase InsO family protein
MPWKVTDVSEQRVQFVVRAAAGREAISRLCLEFGICRPTGYRWLRRYQEAGSVRGLGERSRRPLNSPRQTAAELEDRVVELRQRYGWGARKLHVMLKQQGRTLPVITINRILSRRGLVAEGESHAAATKRFERSAPNELWQMDGKGEYRLRDGTCYPLTILDDCSRYLVGLSALSAFDTANVGRCVVEAFETYGVPEAMLMDHGTVWWSTSNGYGLTALSVGLIKQGIRLIYGRIGHPQTQGKVERFHRTLKEAIRHRGTPQYLRYWPALLAEIRDEYNQERPHEALGMETPAQRYRPSARAYCSEPKEWEYPVGSLVSRLNSQGCLEWGGRRWFVCEALSNEYIRVEVLDQTLLISYRHMYVREIDLEKGRTAPLVFARQES